jgi:hypothetical protein
MCSLYKERFNYRRSFRIGPRTLMPCLSLGLAFGRLSYVLPAASRQCPLKTAGRGHSPAAFGSRATSVAAALIANGGITLLGALYGTARRWMMKRMAVAGTLFCPNGVCLLRATIRIIQLSFRVCTTVSLFYLALPLPSVQLR